jgi:hypothetical protein
MRRPCRPIRRISHRLQPSRSLRERLKLIRRIPVRIETETTRIRSHQPPIHLRQRLSLIHNQLLLRLIRRNPLFSVVFCTKPTIRRVIGAMRNWPSGMSLPHCCTSLQNLNIFLEY